MAEKDEKCCGKVNDDASMHCHAIIMKYAAWQILQLQLAAATATLRNEQQLQLQLTLFKKIVAAGTSCLFCFAWKGDFFFFGCRPQRLNFTVSSDMFAAVAATASVIFSLRLLQQLQLFFALAKTGHAGQRAAS